MAGCGAVNGVEYVIGGNVREDRDTTIEERGGELIV